jgi:hypothetical protein
MTLRVLAVNTGTAALLMAASVLHAQDFPSKTVRKREAAAISLRACWRRG